MPLVGCAVGVNAAGLKTAFEKDTKHGEEGRKANINFYLDDKQRNCTGFVNSVKDVLEKKNVDEKIIGYINEYLTNRKIQLYPVAIPVETESVYVVDGEPIVAEQISEDTEKVTSDNKNGNTLSSQVSNIYSSVKSAISAFSTGGVGDALSLLKGASTVFLSKFIDVLTNGYGYGNQLYNWFMDPNSTPAGLAILRGMITQLSTSIVQYKAIYSFTINKLSPIIINIIDPNLKKIFVSLKKLKTVEINPKTAGFIHDYFTQNSDPNKTFSIEQKTILARILQLLVDIFIILGEIETLDFEVLLKKQMEQGNCEVLKDSTSKPLFDELKECLKIKTQMEKKTYHFLVELLNVLTEAAKTPFFDGGNENNYYSWDVYSNMFVKNGKFVGQIISQQESNKKFNLIALVYVLLNNIVGKLENLPPPPPPPPAVYGGGKANKKTLKKNMHRHSIRLRRNLKTRRRKRQNVHNLARLAKARFAQNTTVESKHRP